MSEVMRNFSRSEEAGLRLLSPDMQRIYSVGISTGGITEMRMAELCPGAHVIATTLDENGVKFSRQLIDEAHLADRIVPKLEDVVGPLPYEDDSFDYVYARLVLHYLTKQSLPVALEGLRQILKPAGKLFAVVRSEDCPDAQRESSVYDDETGLTRYIAGNGKICFRQFHTQHSICEALKKANFNVQTTEQYDEQLFIDYERHQVAPHADNVIEVVATK